MKKPQVTLAALLLTIAAIAATLALMFQAPIEIATPTMVSAAPVALAFLLIGIIYGKGSVRPFCIGAIVPIVMTCCYVTVNLSYLTLWWKGQEERYFGPSELAPRIPMFKDDIVKAFGGLFLASIALGYFCALLRHVVDRRIDDGAD